MGLSVFQILNFVIVLVVLVFLVQYVWDLLNGDSYQPARWKAARKQAEISAELLKSEKNYPDKVRFFNWWFQIERIRNEKIDGAFAELGVYKGQSAKIIHQMAPERTFYLFDTFEGFPNRDLEFEKGEAAGYSSDNFADTELEKVRTTIQGNQNVKFVPGYFPDSVKDRQEVTFAFVNMDVDLYKPTKSGLEYFYPRLSPGGVIIIHDFNQKWEGLVKAVEEFSRSIPESLVVLPDMETTVMIIKHKEIRSSREEDSLN